MGTSSHRNLLRTGHAQEKDIPMTLQRAMTHFAAQVTGKLTRVFDHDQLEALARQSGFVQRSTSKGTGTAFVARMTTAMLDEATVSRDGLCDLLRQRHPPATMTPQALPQRILTPQASTALSEGLHLALREHLAAVGAQLPAALLAPFGRVWLEERTQCRWHANLAEDGKGAGGSASTSTVTIDLIYDYTHTVISALHITHGTAAAQARAAALVPSLRAPDLGMRDWGSCGLPALRQLANPQAYVLRRRCQGGQGCLAANDEAPSLPLVVPRQQPFPRPAVVALDVYVGQQDTRPCRLLASRWPDEVGAHRRRTAHEGARKQGRPPTQASLAWLQYGWYSTNVSRDVWTAAVVGTVYRLRWQIAVTCKHGQALWRLHVLKGTRPERIQGLL
jgi:hypothetical protein